MLQWKDTITFLSVYFKQTVMTHSTDLYLNYQLLPIRYSFGLSYRDSVKDNGSQTNSLTSAKAQPAEYGLGFYFAVVFDTVKLTHFIIPR